MPASVANSLVVNLVPAPAASQPKGNDAPTAADVFTRHLEQAQGAVKRDASTSSTSSADRKSHKSGAAKGTQKAKKPAKAEDADAAPVDDASDEPPEVAVDAVADAGDDVPVEKSVNEPKAAPAAKSNASPADPLAALGLPPVTPAKSPATVAVKQDGKAAAPVAIQDSATEKNIDPDGPAHPTDVATAATDANAAAEAKPAKPAARPAVRTASPLDDVPVAPPKTSAAKAPANLPDATAAITADADGSEAAAATATQVTSAELEKPAPAPTLDPAQMHLAAGGVSATQPSSTTHTAPVAQQAAPLPPEARFAETNHVNIVSSVQANLLPHGGTMQIRLDPPELGALQVTVEMRNGTMSATFQTSNEDATRLLSHSMGQLKTALEAQGVTVDKIQVQQAPKDQQSQSHEGSSQQQLRDEANARQEQQRREMLQRMWRRVSGVDPVDMVA